MCCANKNNIVITRKLGQSRERVPNVDHKPIFTPTFMSNCPIGEGVLYY